MTDAEVWLHAFCSYAGHISRPDVAAERADDALKEYQKRFPEIDPKTRTLFEKLVALGAREDVSVAEFRAKIREADQLIDEACRKKPAKRSKR